MTPSLCFVLRSGQVTTDLRKAKAFRPDCGPPSPALDRVDAPSSRDGKRARLPTDAVGSGAMARPVTLITGQWADLPIEELAAKTGAWGYDGLELACWGDHFEVDRALAEPGYCRDRRALLERHGLGCWAIASHLIGQAVCDRIDERHRAILPPDVWGDGDADGVRRRAAAKMQDVARAAAQLGVDVVTGFT